jgi:hypothetical protein
VSSADYVKKNVTTDIMLDRMSPLSVTKKTSTTFRTLYEFILPISKDQLDYLESKANAQSRIVDTDKHIDIPFFMKREELKDSTFYKVALIDPGGTDIKDFTQVDQFINAKSIFIIKPDLDLFGTDKITMLRSEIDADKNELLVEEEVNP